MLSLFLAEFIVLNGKVSAEKFIEPVGTRLPLFLIL